MADKKEEYQPTTEPEEDCRYRRGKFNDYIGEF